MLCLPWDLLNDPEQPQSCKSFNKDNLMHCRSPLRMQILVFIAACVVVAVLLGLKMPQAKTGIPQRPAAVHFFRGMSDASAAAVLSDKVFVMADDERNILHYYRKDGPVSPVGSLDLTSFLNTEPGSPEADIEAAARLGNRIYWISSHGRNKDGKLRTSRYRFFATRVVESDDQWRLEPEGKPCTTLLETLIRLPALRQYGFDQAADLNEKKRERLAPKQEGINIEALCSAPDGKTLYLGFRNPRPGGKAVVIPLQNAYAVIARQETPAFGTPILWDLQGLGLRSMEYSPHHGRCFAVAGYHDGRAGGVLYEWSGSTADPPRLIGPILPGVPEFTPEALVIFSGPEGLWFFSDDGSRLIDIVSPTECLPGKARNNQCENKYLIDPHRKTFRGAKLVPRWPPS